MKTFIKILKQLLTAIFNFFMVLLLPVWGGWAILYGFLCDVKNNGGTARDILKGKRLFWK